MDFSLSPELVALQKRTRQFVDEIVIPAEPNIPHEVEAWRDLRASLQVKARGAGLFLPQMSREWGGLGLNWRERAVIFEEAGRRLLGAMALYRAAPDEGNLHLLDKIGSSAQKERYVLPLTTSE